MLYVLVVALLESEVRRVDSFHSSLEQLEEFGEKEHCTLEVL